jgi:hypothetical protein
MVVISSVTATSLHDVKAKLHITQAHEIKARSLQPITSHATTHHSNNTIEHIFHQKHDSLEQQSILEELEEFKQHMHERPVLRLPLRSLEDIVSFESVFHRRFHSTLRSRKTKYGVMITARDTLLLQPDNNSHDVSPAVNEDCYDDDDDDDDDDNDDDDDDDKDDDNGDQDEDEDDEHHTSLYVSVVPHMVSKGQDAFIAHVRLQRLNSIGMLIV